MCTENDFTNRNALEFDSSSLLLNTERGSQSRVQDSVEFEDFDGLRVVVCDGGNEFDIVNGANTRRASHGHPEPSKALGRNSEGRGKKTEDNKG